MEEEFRPINGWKGRYETSFGLHWKEVENDN